MNNTQWSIVKRVRNLFSAKLFIIVYLFLSVGFANAQFEQHLTWKSEVEKISETEFKIKFICTLEDEWHTYSQFTKEGGPLPTQFRFEKNKDILLSVSYLWQPIETY